MLHQYLAQVWGGGGRESWVALMSPGTPFLKEFPAVGLKMAARVCADARLFAQSYTCARRRRTRLRPPRAQLTSC